MGKRLHLWRGTAHRTPGAVVGIDAGHVDVRVVIATMDAERTSAAPDDAVPVLGAGVVPAQGLSRGVVTDPRRLGAAIRTAVAQAERAAGHRVLGAYFSVPLSQFHTATRGERPGRIVLTSPIAVREVSLHAAERAAIWHEVARHAGLEVVGIVPSALAASAAVVLPEEHEQGAIVVECGAEHTSVAVFSGGTVQLLGTVPVGGDHITRDLASVLGIDPLEAERLKFEIGNARTGMPGVEVLVRGQNGQRTAVSVALIAAIVSARVDQMLGHVGEMVQAGRVGGERRAGPGRADRWAGAGDPLRGRGGALRPRADGARRPRYAGADRGRMGIRGPGGGAVAGLCLGARAITLARDGAVPDRAAGAEHGVARPRRIVHHNKFGGNSRVRPTGSGKLAGKHGCASSCRERYWLPCGGDEHRILWVREIDPHRGEWRRGRTRACLNLTSRMAAKTLPR